MYVQLQKAARGGLIINYAQYNVMTHCTPKSPELVRSTERCPSESTFRGRSTWSGCEPTASAARLYCEAHIWAARRRGLRESGARRRPRSEAQAEFKAESADPLEPTPLEPAEADWSVTRCPKSLQRRSPLPRSVGPSRLPGAALQITSIRTCMRSSAGLEPVPELVRPG